MTCIHLHAHPLAGTPPQVFEVPSLALWLLEHYGQTPQVTVNVFAGEPSLETDITQDTRAILRGDAPEYTVLQSPGGTELIWYLVTAVVGVAAAYLLVPKPVMPGNVNRTQTSPNNALADRENKVRLLERVEDIYGTVKSIPSLMMPTYNKYINHKKFEYGYYCVGRGYCTVSALKDADTPLADITGASAAVYHPFTSPNSGTPVLQIGDAIVDNVITAARAVEVDGITLKAPNQVQLPTSAVYTFTPDSGGGTITQDAKEPNFNSVADVGDELQVTMTATTAVSGGGVDYNGDVVTTVVIFVTGATRTLLDANHIGLFANMAPGDVLTLAGFANPGNNGTFTIATKASSYQVTLSAGSMVDEEGAGIILSVTRNYSGTYEIAGVGDGFVQLTALSTSGWTSTMEDVTCSVQMVGKSEYTGWITLDAADRTEVWVNIVAANGIFFDQNGNKANQTIAYELVIEKLHATTLAPLGVVETVSDTLSGSTAEERAETLEHVTAWVGPARVRMRRTSTFPYEADGTVVDEIKWQDLYSITPVTKADFGNKTTIHTITQATVRATAVKTRQLNCLASRLLPTYNGTTWSGVLDATGLLSSGTLAATSKLVDIIAAVTIDPKIGARSITDLDLAQIWTVQGQLDAWATQCGQVNYTLDTDNTSFEETLVMIANAGFCIAYRQNGKVRLTFDRAQPASTALFTHRNKKPNAETITRQFSSDSDYDGVKFVYVDPDTEQSETITLPLDDSGTKFKKFEIAGIRSFTQAWYRAKREYARLIGQRITIETTTTLDARSLLPNTRIDVVDNTRFKSYDGEVIGQSGLTLTLSQDVAFVPATAHSIVLMRRDGSLQSIACTAGGAANQVVLASLPTESVVTSYGAAGIRTIYSFAADSARGAQAYLVQELDISDAQYCTVRAVNYTADYYAADTEAVPDKATIIN